MTALFKTSTPVARKGAPVPTAKPRSSATGKRDALYGTGITKRELERAGKQAERQLAAPIESAEPTATATIAMPMATAVKLPGKLVDTGLTLDPHQREAMALANQRFGCLIGAAGTGKTTVSKHLIHRIELEMVKQQITLGKLKPSVLADVEAERGEPPVNIAICAYTGKATQQIRSKLPRRYHSACDTIHGTLKFQPTYEDYIDPDTGAVKTRMRFEPAHNAMNKLDVDAIFVDESGTCPVSLWNQLFEALPSHCQIILIGDINQLPPTMGRSVLGFAMLEWPTYTLLKVHRTADDSSVIHNAHRILGGHSPEAMPDRNYRLQEIPADANKGLLTALSAVRYLTESGWYDPTRDGFIVPQNIGQLGQESLNQHLVHYFNPPRTNADGLTENPRISIRAGSTMQAFATGDRVMLNRNWRQRGLTNGMLGTIVAIDSNQAYNGNHIDSLASNTADMRISSDALANLLAAADTKITGDNDDNDEEARQASHVVHVLFDHNLTDASDSDPLAFSDAFSTIGEVAELRHAYAFTCHKAQGSEFRHVIYLAHNSNQRMLCREWLYTAATRAREGCVLLYTPSALRKGLYNQRIKGRTTAEKARAFIALQDATDTEMPELPAPNQLDRYQEEVSYG